MPALLLPGFEILDEDRRARLEIRQALQARDVHEDAARDVAVSEVVDARAWCSPSRCSRRRGRSRCRSDPCRGCGTACPCGCARSRDTTRGRCRSRSRGSSCARTDCRCRGRASVSGEWARPTAWPLLHERRRLLPLGVGDEIQRAELVVLAPSSPVRHLLEVGIELVGVVRRAGRRRSWCEDHRSGRRGILRCDWPRRIHGGHCHGKRRNHGDETASDRNDEVARHGAHYARPASDLSSGRACVRSLAHRLCGAEDGL